MEVPMEHFVTLARFPERLKFPKEFADRIRYEPETRRLYYRGPMSKADFDRLNRLSDDWAYRRPLEELFRLCTLEASRKPVFARLLSVFTPEPTPNVADIRAAPEAA